MVIWKMSDYDFGMLLFMFYAYNKEQGIDIFEEMKKQNLKAEYERAVQESCPKVEWERDMCTYIPFCRDTDRFCDLHCIRGDVA